MRAHHERNLRFGEPYFDCRLHWTHLKRDQGWSRITLVGRFAPCAGFVTLRQTFVRRSQNCGMVPRETTGASQAASGFALSGKPITSALEPWSKVSAVLTLPRPAQGSEGTLAFGGHRDRGVRAPATAPIAPRLA